MWLAHHWIKADSRRFKGLEERGISREGKRGGGKQRATHTIATHPQRLSDEGLSQRTCESEIGSSRATREEGWRVKVRCTQETSGAKETTLCSWKTQFVLMREELDGSGREQGTRNVLVRCLPDTRKDGEGEGKEEDARDGIPDATNSGEIRRSQEVKWHANPGKSHKRTKQGVGRQAGRDELRQRTLPPDPYLHRPRSSFDPTEEGQGRKLLSPEERSPVRSALHKQLVYFESSN